MVWSQTEAAREGLHSFTAVVDGGVLFISVLGGHDDGVESSFWQPLGKKGRQSQASSTAVQQVNNFIDKTHLHSIYLTLNPTKVCKCVKQMKQNDNLIYIWDNGTVGIFGIWCKIIWTNNDGKMKIQMKLLIFIVVKILVTTSGLIVLKEGTLCLLSSNNMSSTGTQKR